METKLINRQIKGFLIGRIQLLKFGMDRQNNYINDNWLTEPEWKDKLCSLTYWKDILNYAHKIANEILSIQGKELWKSGHFKFEDSEQEEEFWKYFGEDQKELVKELENSLQEGANHKQKAEQILTNLKNILGDDLNNWETKIGKKTELDQANNFLTQLQQKISDLTQQLNDPNNKSNNHQELEEQIKQLTADLEKANNQEPPQTNPPTDYHEIKNELEQLREQAANSEDSELAKKMVELLDKMSAREREREREQKSKTNEPPTRW